MATRGAIRDGRNIGTMTKKLSRKRVAKGIVTDEKVKQRKRLIRKGGAKNIKIGG